LGKVIIALTDKKGGLYVPYRDSKLTRLLSQSLGGNSKTCLVVTLSPHRYSDAETHSSLRFGATARNIKNKPQINKEYTVPELKKLLDTEESRVKRLQHRIKVLEKIISDMGG